MARIAVYAGSFDPVTVGHEDIIRRAAKLCDTLHVVVMHNVLKQGEFPVDERVALLKKATADVPNVVIGRWDGLMVDYVRRVGAQFVVRGVRSSRDFDSEQTLHQLNERLLPGLETILLMSRPELMCISSSAVREAAHFGADWGPFVPASVRSDIEEHFARKG